MHDDDAAGTSARQLLTATADVYIKLSDGNRLPASKFVLAMRSPVMRGVMESCTLQREPMPRPRSTPGGAVEADAEADAEAPLVEVLPLLGAVAHPQSVSLALDVIHGVRAVQELTLSQMPALREGMDILGCDHFNSSITLYIWTLLATSADPLEFVPHLDCLLSMSLVRAECLERMVVLVPTWSAFVSTFIDAMADLPFTVADFMMARLAPFFPAGLLFTTLLQKLCASSPTPGEHALSLLGCRGTGVHFHPVEARDAVDAVLAAAGGGPGSPGHDQHVLVLRNLSLALGQYDASPFTHAGVGGTLIGYYRSATASALLDIGNRLKLPKTLRPAQWMTLRMDLASVTLSIDVPKMMAEDRSGVGPNGTRAVDVRIMTYCPATAEDVETHTFVVSETWFSIKDLGWPDNQAALHLRTPCSGHYLQDDMRVTKTFGDTNFMDTVKHARLHRLRVDVFVGPTSALAAPLGVR